jgi:hypothetical protein
MYIPCHQTENQNNFRQGTLENDWTSTSELERIGMWQVSGV